MENSSQPKKRTSTKIIYVVIVVLVGLVVLSVVLFYFLPIPQNLKQIAKSTNLERCIYNEGIGYYAKFAGEDVPVEKFYNSSGKEVCAAGGFSGVPLENCAHKMCIKTYDN